MRVVADSLGCSVTDAAENRFSWLLELRRVGVPQLQVRLAVCSLRQMWANKVEALRSRPDFRSRLGTLLPPEERERIAGRRLGLLAGAIAQALGDRTRP